MPDYAKEMQLPSDKTCADCKWCKWCVGIGCTKAENTSCDYYPNRFEQVTPAAAPQKG